VNVVIRINENQRALPFGKKALLRMLHNHYVAIYSNFKRAKGTLF
jgi:hypothetical protein